MKPNPMRDLIRELWNEGCSAGEIAKHLNVTRNVVVGIVHREGLTRPRKMLRPFQYNNAPKPKTVKPAEPKPIKLRVIKEEPLKSKHYYSEMLRNAVLNTLGGK